MNKYHVREFETYYPELVDLVESYADGDPWELIVKFKDGRIFSYYALEQNLRELPKEDSDEEIVRQEFGIRLRRKMYLKEMLQVDLSEATGIPQSQLSNYIQGKRLPTFASLIKIAKALDCPLDYFQVFRKF